VQSASLEQIKVELFVYFEDKNSGLKQGKLLSLLSPKYSEETQLPQVWDTPEHSLRFKIVQFGADEQLTVFRIGVTSAMN
jgi:hypothetical protein